MKTDRTHFNIGRFKTEWNSSFSGGKAMVTPAFDTDNAAGFSISELTSIQQVWQRVAEDFRPFHIDMTTQKLLNGRNLIRSSKFA